MSKDVNCPYCDNPQDINHDDGYGYEEGQLHQQQCHKCDKTFTFTTSISFYYETYESECLNEGQHIWKPQTGYPREWMKMECQTCEEVRMPTEEERIEFDIPHHKNETK